MVREMKWGLIVGLMAAAIAGCVSGDDGLFPPDAAMDSGALDGGDSERGDGSIEADAEASDEDCGGEGPQRWFADVDGDGDGDGRIWVIACEAPAGFVDRGSDPEPECATNDTDECGVCAGAGRLEFFADLDGDGLGDPMMSLTGCAAPTGYADNADDPEPACATDDTDECGVCAGPGPSSWYRDGDGDGLGDIDDEVSACAAPEGFVAEPGDAEPDCPSNDTDVCGVCAGAGRITVYIDADGDGLGDPAESDEICEVPDGWVDNADDREPECATNDTDECGVCGGQNGDMDCNGVCQGNSRHDACGLCSGGDTGVEPHVDDEDGDGVPDFCDDDCPQYHPTRLYVQWTEVAPFEGDGGPYTFQLVLEQTGRFWFRYHSVEPFGATNTVGYQIDGERGASLGFDTEFVVDHPLVVFTPNDEPGRDLDVDYAADLPWLDIRPLGEDLDLPDDGSTEIDLGFGFPFADTYFGSVIISANGLVGFEGRLPEFENSALPNAEFGRFIAPFWDNLNPQRGGTIHYYVARAACEADCNGDRGGFAFEDACGDCVGGATGVAPAVDIDCNGICDGEAIIDRCGLCAGGDTGIEPSGEGDCLPDLIVDNAYLRRTIRLDYIDAEDQCLLDERCVRGLGRRKIIRFGTRIANVGTADLRLGRPEEGNDDWTWDECHRHFHFVEYAHYDLRHVETDEVLPIGAKSGFAVIDIGVYDPQIAVNGCRGYNGQDQGISAGCHDTYSHSLLCQWIDVTDVPDGTYDVIITTNANARIEELDTENNSTEVRVVMSGDELDVLEADAVP